MFSWFLKLLGIDEDRSTSSGNSYLESNAKKETVTPAAETVKEPESKKKPESEPVPEKKEELDSSTEAVETSPKPKPKPKSEPEAASKSLADDFLGLKANYIKVFEEAGFTTKAAIDKATDKELLALKGIGKATLKIIRA